LTLQLVAYHVDILSLTIDDGEAPMHYSSDTVTSLSGFAKAIRMGYRNKPYSERFASTHYNGWADTRWICTVGLGCVCEEGCDEDT
jgi:hypothetical protein